jgi:multiple sugar transport system ATP-binding protein
VLSLVLTNAWFSAMKLVAGWWPENGILPMSAVIVKSVLHADGLVKRFRGITALSGVSLDAPQGSLTVLLGPAGAGKTTTLRVIAGLEDPDEGRVFLNGRDVSALEPKDRDIGMIFDNLALYPNKTAFENIASPLIIRRVPSNQIEESVRRMADTLHVSHLLGRLPKTMSGGERQRVALGRALIRKPALCLLDEPLSSLDAMLRIELRAELRRLQRELGYTFVLASPDFAEAMAVADTVVMLRAGKVVQTSSPQVLYEAPADREIARFVGSPEINLLPASLQSAQFSEFQRIRQSTGRDQRHLYVAGAMLPIPRNLPDSFLAETCEFEVGIRPEYLRLADVEGAATSAELIDIEPLGLQSTLTFRNNHAQFRVMVEAHQAARLRINENVGIDFSHVPFLAFDKASGVRIW